MSEKERNKVREAMKKLEWIVSMSRDCGYQPATVEQFHRVLIAILIDVDKAYELLKDSQE